MGLKSVLFKNLALHITEDIVTGTLYRAFFIFFNDCILFSLLMSPYFLNCGCIVYASPGQ